MYRCSTTSIPGFVQQLAIAYLAHGYWFHVPGCIPEGKDPEAVDQKLIERYGVDITRWARARRKKAGVASVQYLRFHRFFVLLATHGRHPIFQEEEKNLRDARRTPIRFAGYSISYRHGHPHVRINQEDYLWMKAALAEKAVHRSAEQLCAEFLSYPYEPYAPVRRQLLNLWRMVNRRRGEAGLPKVPVQCIRMRRRIVKPFE